MNIPFCLLTANLIASIGPKPINDGSTPTELHEVILPKISKFFVSAIFFVVKTTPAAPSLIPDELPGVTVPFSLKTVFNLFRS